MSSIRRNLLKWQIGALLVTGLVASLITCMVAWNLFNDIRNDGLAQIAYSIVRHGVLPADGAEDENDAADEGQFISQIWDSNKELQYSSLDNEGPPPQKPGHHRLTWHGEKWHTYTLEDGGLTIQVGNPVAHRLPLFRKVAAWLLLPLSLMVAVLGGLIWLAVGRTLRPLEQFQTGILRQNVRSLQALDIADLPQEVAPLGEALNDLLLRLERAFVTERNFIADAAHELRTPLTAVRLQAQLASSAQGSGQSEKALQQLMAGVDRASHLVDQLLQMARLEPESQAIRFAELRMDILAKESVADFSAQAEARGIDLGMVRCQAAQVLGHAPSLRVLLSNLIDNALRYTPSNGRVDVEVEDSPGVVTLTVSDTGPGISPQFRARAFDRFFRLANNDTPGSGLGLSIAENVARLHAGKITLEDAPSGGLLVRFVMPSAMGDKPAGADSQTAGPAQGSA